MPVLPSYRNQSVDFHSKLNRLASIWGQHWHLMGKLQDSVHLLFIHVCFSLRNCLRNCISNCLKTDEVCKIFLIFWNVIFKACAAIFPQIFISHQMIALQKIWKMYFISSKKLFSFSRYSSFSIFVFPSFSPCRPLL